MKYNGNSYNIPASVFNDLNNWNNNGFYYSTGVVNHKGINATGVKGRSIFWKVE